MGGYTDPETGRELDSGAALEEAMSARGFSQIYDEPMPLVIREHAVSL